MEKKTSFENKKKQKQWDEWSMNRNDALLWKAVSFALAFNLNYWKGFISNIRGQQRSDGCDHIEKCPNVHSSAYFPEIVCSHILHIYFIVGQDSFKPQTVLYCNTNLKTCAKSWCLKCLFVLWGKRHISGIAQEETWSSILKKCQSLVKYPWWRFSSMTTVVAERKLKYSS